MRIIALAILVTLLSFSVAHAQPPYNNIDYNTNQQQTSQGVLHTWHFGPQQAPISQADITLHLVYPRSFAILDFTDSQELSCVQIHANAVSCSGDSLVASNRFDVLVETPFDAGQCYVAAGYITVDGLTYVAFDRICPVQVAEQETLSITYLPVFLKSR